MADTSSVTERLYYADSYLRVFDARILDVSPHGGEYAVILDRTAFFPTSGGQPHDLGVIGGAEVTDVIDGGDVVVHVVTRPAEGMVRGEIDWPRRFDHMQQHTGQHILSQAALRVLGAHTRAVHFGAELCTLDLDRADLTPEMAERAEDLANAIVAEDRPVSARMVDEAALPELGLRRPARPRGAIRVVEVEEFDRSACGGTHVRRTGEIGLIKIRRWERHRGGLRLEFLCGGRALRDYRWKHALLAELAATMTVGDREVGEAVGRLQGQLRERDREVAALRARELSREARAYLEASGGSPKIIAEVLDRPPEEAVHLAGTIVALEPAVVVFGAAGGRVVIARSPAVALDAGALLRRVLDALDGRGGGRPEFAQGAVPEPALARAVAAAREAVAQSLHA